MKTKKLISALFVPLLTLFFILSVSNLTAQSKHKCSDMKECCMMKNGKMMHMKDGKMMPMKKDMVMKNGTTCMVNGKCKMKDGTTMKMKDGHCMDMNGNMCCKKMEKGKCCDDMAAVYTCPMHKEVTSNKQGKCPKCKMDLVKKK